MAEPDSVRIAWSGTAGAFVRRWVQTGRLGGRVDTTDRLMVSLLEVKGLTKAFGRVHAVSGVDLDCSPGEVMALVGENGAGKSTLVRCLAGSIHPDQGTVLLSGRPLGRTPGDVVRQGISVVWQDLALCDNLDTVANIFLGREVGRSVLDSSLMRVETDHLLESLGLDTVDVTVPVGALSGGARQMVALARAVLDRPAVLILDEPTAALGVHDSTAVEQLILRMAAMGSAVLLVSHELDQVFRVANRIAVMRRGEIVADVSRLEVHPDDIAALMSGVHADTTASQQLRRLHSLTDQLAEADPASVLPLTVTAMTNALSVDMLCVYLVAEGPDGVPCLARSAAVGLPAMTETGAVLEFGAAGGSVGVAAEEGRLVIVEDVRTDPIWKSGADQALMSKVASTWAAPIIGTDGLIGVVSGFGTTVGRPQEDQLDLVRLFTSQAAAAIERGRLLDELTVRNTVLETLHGILEALAGPDPVSGGVAVALLALCRGLRADAAAIYVSDDGQPARCLEAMYPSPGSAAASRGARQLETVVPRSRRAVSHQDDGWITDDVAVTRFETPLGATTLATFWDDSGVAPFGVSSLLSDAAKSFHLAFEREKLAASRQEADALRRSNQMQRTFVSRLSHELRTPLTAIHGFATSLQQPDVDWQEDDRSRFLASIASESARLSRLVTNLLDASKIDAGILQLEKDWCDLALVLETAIACVPGAPDVTRLDSGTRTEPVWADHDRLEQVFVNLVSNAVRHNPLGTKVEIGVMPGLLEGTVVVRVSDDGSGLPSGVAGALLRDSAGELSDTGFGLKISRGILESHGGSLLLEQVSGGTSLLVTLPTQPGPADNAGGESVDGE